MAIFTDYTKINTIKNNSTTINRVASNYVEVFSSSGGYTWVYNGTSDDYWCSSPGSPMIGTSCTSVGEVRVIDGELDGIAGCIEIICE